ncbi:4-aminobutyrate--2-oxoglutarate transaminase [Corynebacterium sp. TAE3-ERU12]|uniref:4-aminobutyrate--2-oxoglutarate transaminase n=1 Tax=Corynebacterium sp. TAE3-ERU12 TaxID=2849491 RepID=UPI002101F58D|nr:4-aminobutyrate--2-oxoglutarate transaminase [Corynebacterium sp. TAE3-ERU12]
MSTTPSPASSTPTGHDIPQKRTLITDIPGPKSQEWTAFAEKNLPEGLKSGQHTWAQTAGGGIVVDVDGNHLIDLGSGIATTTVGNAAPEVAAAIADQAEKLTHTCFLNQPYTGYVELANRLNTITPGDHEKRTALFSTGAEALENAVKYARVHTGRTGVIVFDHAFHGRTNMTMGMTAKNAPYKQSFGPFPSDIYRAPSPYPFRWPGGAESAADDVLSQLELLVDAQIGAGNIACIVFEPIQGEGGFIVPPKGFLPRLVDFCHERGILFVADEVQTGLARTGDLFACEDENIVPDLMTLAKGLGGGMPISAVVGAKDIMDSAHRGGIGGTYAGNPVACAAALAVLDLIERDDLTNRARQIGQRITAAFEKAQANTSAIGEIRGRGAMIAVEIVGPDGNTPDAARTADIARRCEQRGVIVLTAGTHGNVIRLLPPLSISDELLDDGLQILTEEIAR